MKKKWQEVDWKTKLVGLFVLTLITGIYVDFFYEKDEIVQSEPQRLLNLIPPGYVLQVLDLESPESLDVLVEDFAFVSLYQPGATQPFVTGLKVFRAPRSPEQFVALIPTNRAQGFVKNNEQLTAIVESRPPASGTIFVRTPIKPQRLILYGNTEI